LTAKRELKAINATKTSAANRPSTERLRPRLTARRLLLRATAAPSKPRKTALSTPI
jgi:hypothetical protein